ncbi:putative response regulatory protein [Paraliobacillus sp. PM-2]|uniref:response regulator transcription factor n=1 Tax=Paraliobacillus sp. PM-2 TaxID=1462524 RepID=UPI00061C55FA|nr:response regulator [Paraliobacillus sp. PM-2]CQR48453.1 putative response regulatory protein [Paraliobacillus sp. PM-2]
MLKVLLVDDELLTIRMLKRLIDWEKFNFELVGYAKDGEEAYEAYLKYEPNIIITDIQMPNMTGMDFIKKVRETNKQTKIILVSAYGDFLNIQAAMKMGCSDYILKPIDEQELNEALKRVAEKIDVEEEQKRMINKSELQIKKLQLWNYMKTGVNTHHILKLQKGYNLNFESYYILIFELYYNTIDEFVNMQNIESLQMGYITRIMNHKLSDYQNILFEFEGSSWIALLSGIDQETLVYLSREIITTLKEDFHINVKACFSDCINELEDLPMKYKQTKLLCRYNFYVDTEDILGYGYNCKEEDFKQIQRNTLVSEVEEALKVKDIATIEKLLNEIFYLSKHINPFELDLIYEMCFEIIMIMKKIISDKSKKTVQMDDILSISYQDILELKSINSLKDYMWKLITEILNQHEQHKQQYSDLVKEGITVIESNYNKSLSLEDICNEISISKNYFCYLFKREVGTSLWHYLTELRLKKAKELLLETDMKSYEISFQVGYDNPSYFSKLFKKYEEMTPNEFRKQMQKQ